ncbi:MAG: peptidase M13 [Alphaproteobacteria bacterium]|uniref:M13 family metallopeptidase n=1 Tax=Brevundimonas sp. TaxID=1871086 RepID=UPI00182DEB7D|nr:M13-type metalloendopeptidase [Brevundimonas sp.]MBA3048347.1 peptidase M13 [Brevundimonas sp.]MBU3971343.1 peptidase M13 [Alphaproteobacteria bacterium]MBU3974713.1 peptidase M13 [Alphaproteobacteria bacterium]
MKKLLIGAALGALLLPASMASAQVADEHGHACVDESCTVFELFQVPAEGATVLGYQGTDAPKYGTWGFDLAGRDTSVSPGDSFMRYANGSAMDQMQIPSDRTSYGSFALLRELSDNRVKAMIEGLVARTDLTPGSDEQKIADAYRSYMDEGRIEALDAQPLQPYLAAIRAANTHDLAAVYMGETQGRIGGSIFGTGITTDQKAPTRYVVSTGQSGLGLPNRDYYLEQRWAEKKALYQAYVARMLEMIGWDNPAASAEAVVAFETRIAEAHWTPIQNRNRDETYNEYTIAQLAAEAPGFPWQAYYTAVGVGEVPRLIVRQDTAMPLIAAIYAETPMETIQAWQAFHTTDDAAPRLSRRFADAQWEFRSRDLNGQPMQRPRDKRGISFAEGMLGEAVGRQYVAEYFPAESKAKMEQLVANLRLALGARIRNYSWMSAETRAAAQEKLDKFTVKIGYPNTWRDYASLEVRPDDLFGNAERAGLFQWNYRLSRLNEPVDKTEWGMTPQTVNAYYNSTNNEIVFPAAILQPPFFDPDADPAVNYGGIGGVIGHEIGHGFDDQGSKSDGDGVLRSWWTPEDRANFDALTTRLGAQYDQFEPIPGFHVQGGLTMGENIGDAAGVAVGLEAYHLSLNGQPSPVLDGITGDQRFFYGWAQVWQSKMRDDALRNQIATDPHSPAEFRVIGPVRNVDAWYEAFDVQPGSKYYLSPEERVRIW